MKRPLTKFALAAVAAGALVLSGCSAGSGPSGGDGKKAPITVGVLLPLTGSLSTLGIEMGNGYELAREMFNDAGGVDGRKIEFKKSDAPTPDDAVSVAGDLSSDSNVALIMGSYSSNISIPASAVASRNGKVYWETGGVSADVTGRGLPNLYRTVISSGMPAYSNATDTFISEVAAPSLNKSVSDLRFGLVHEDGTYGTAAAQAFTTLAKSKGYDLVDSESYSATTNDLTSVIEKLKAAKIDVLYSVPGISDAILLTRQSKELGFTPAFTLGNGTGYTSPDFASGVGSAADGIVVSDATPLHIKDSMLDPDVSPKYSQFVEAYTKKFGHEPLTHATLGFAGAMVLFEEVLSKAKSIDTEGINAAAKAVNLPDGGTVAGFGVKFDKTGQNERAGWYFMQYQGGKLVTIYPEKFSSGDVLVGK